MAKSETVAPVTELVPISQQASVVDTTARPQIDLSKLKIARVVTRPVLQLKEYTPVVFKCVGKIELGKEIKGKAAGEKAAHLMPIQNVLENSREMQIVVPAVLQAELEENYPDHSYVGKIFGVEKMEKVEGKRYHNYNIVELAADQFGN